MSAYSFVDPGAFYFLPGCFDFDGYMDTEQEFWAFFPETLGKRVTFAQTGLTARLYVESPQDGSELAPDESYFLMPCEGRIMRPLRMRAGRRLTLEEFRMTHLTAVKLSEKLLVTSPILDDVHMQVLGPELLDEY